MRIAWIAILASIVFAPASTRAAEPRDAQLADLRKIKLRAIDEMSFKGLPASPLIDQEVKYLDRCVDGWLAEKGGYWSKWKTIDHSDVTYNGVAFVVPMEMARAYRMPASRHYRRPQVLAAIESGLRHLAKFAYPDCKQPNNWWAWRLGMPIYLTPTLMLLEHDLDRDLFQREVATVQYLIKADKDVKLEGAFDGPAEAKSGETDMNELWFSRVQLELAVLIENPAMAGKWARKAFAEMGEPGHGPLQSDWSYKFHRQTPMWAYGRSFLMEYSLLVMRYEGTYLGPSPAQLDRFTDMIAHFINGFHYRLRLCPAFIGREISVDPRPADNPSGLLALAIMAKARHPRADELARLFAREWRGVDAASEWPPHEVNPDTDWMTRLAGRVENVRAAEPAPPVDDIFAYPDSDYLQVTRPHWALGIKMHSRRNGGYESILGQNMQGWFLSHGSMFHYLTGREWDACWPTLDWTRLPGTTVSDRAKKQNESAFVGVVRASDHLALAAMELKRADFAARKSWLVDGDTIVCLGSDISGPGRVETTVLNQPVAADAPVLIDGQPATAEPLDQQMTVHTVWAAGMGYVFPGGAQVHIMRESRISDWGSIRDRRRHLPGEPVTHHYVTAVISHGPGARGYCYLVLPNVQQAEWPAKAKAALDAYEIKTAGAHTVHSRDGRIDSVVLWQAGEAGQLRADRGCLALSTAQAWQIVDPTWDKHPLSATIGGKQESLRLTNGRPASVDR